MLSKGQFSDFERGRIVEMREAGWSYRAIGYHLYCRNFLCKGANSNGCCRYLSVQSVLQKATGHECKAKSSDYKTGPNNANRIFHLTCYILFQTICGVFYDLAALNLGETVLTAPLVFSVNFHQVLEQMTNGSMCEATKVSDPSFQILSLFYTSTQSLPLLWG